LPFDNPGMDANLPKPRRWFRLSFMEWFVIAVIITLLLMLIESPSYYPEKGSTTGKHYGPITRWLTGWQ
jgi:hypothetical protein